MDTIHSFAIALIWLLPAKLACKATDINGAGKRALARMLGKSSTWTIVAAVRTAP